MKPNFVTTLSTNEQEISMTHKFVINTENVNAYGYRILTDGVDYSQYMRNPVVLFMHERFLPENRGDEVIGKTVSLSKEGNNLVAEIEFHENNEFAQKIAKKVEDGILRMASMYAEKIDSSTAPEDILPGQTYATVKKCKLVEISIVDIGGNDDALKLSKGNENEQILEKINTKPTKIMNQFKVIALALGKSADSDEAATLAAVNELKLAKETAENEAKEWKDKFIQLQKTEAENLVEKAVKLGLVNEALKSAQVTDLLSDFDAKKVVLAKLIEDKEKELEKTGKTKTVATAVQLAKGATVTEGEDGKESFDYLQKHNALELKRIQEEEPEKYAKLAKEYAAGVRYTAK